jgi:hypothetical protein
LSGGFFIVFFYHYLQNSSSQSEVLGMSSKIMINLLKLSGGFFSLVSATCDGY